MNTVRAKLLEVENELTEERARNGSSDNQGLKLRTEVDYAISQNELMIKEMQDITAKKDKLELEFSKLDHIERDFERAVRKIEE